MDPLRNSHDLYAHLDPIAIDSDSGHIGRFFWVNSNPANPVPPPIPAPMPVDEVFPYWGDCAFVGDDQALIDFILRPLPPAI